MTNKIKTLFLVTSALATLPFTATAQDNDEIIVTAQKRAQSISDVGITINAFASDTLKDLGVDGLIDIASFTPGLVFSEAGGLGVPVYTIRGVGFDDYSAGSNSTVGVYVDEVALPYPVMTRGMMFDLERVEVLKGPQGDLYGRNATGGAVNFINARPTDEFEGEVSVGYGSYETITANGFLSGPLGDGLRARLSGTLENSSEGWMQSHTRDETLGRADKAAIRLLMDWDASDNVEARLNLHYTRDKSENAGQARSGRLGQTSDPFGLTAVTLPSGWLSLPVAAGGLGNAGIAVADGLAPAAPEEPDVGDWNDGFTPQNDNNLFGGSVTLNWDFGAATLTSISAYDKFDRNDSFDWDGTALSLFEQTSDTEIESFSQELRLTSNGSGPLSWIGGLYYSDDEVNDSYLANVGEASGSSGLFADVRHTLDQDTRTLAAYGHAEYEIDDQWGLTLGARYTDEKRSGESCSFDADGGLGFLFSGLDLIDFDLGGTGDDFFLTSTPLAPGDCVTADTSRGSVVADANGPGTLAIFGGVSDVFRDELKTGNFSGKVGIDFAASDDLLLYASVGSGFKSGGFNGALASTWDQLTPYQEETLLAYEAGFKATLAEGRFKLNGAAFLYDYKDKQTLSIINDPTFGPLAALVNVPKSEVLGAELEGSWKLTDEFDINFGVSLLDTEVKEYLGFHPLFPGATPVDFAGAELGSAPSLTTNIRAVYETDVSDNLFVRLSGDVNYSSEYHAGLEYVNPTDDRFNVDAYTLFNARVAVGSHDNWDLAASVRNIGDTYHYHSASFSNDAITRAVGRGRTWALTLTKQFN